MKIDTRNDNAVMVTGEGVYNSRPSRIAFIHPGVCVGRSDENGRRRDGETERRRELKKIKNRKEKRRSRWETSSRGNNAATRTEHTPYPYVTRVHLLHCHFPVALPNRVPDACPSHRL